MGSPLSQADLATRAYVFAAIVSLLDDIKQVFTGTRTNLDDLPGLFNDMKIRLEDSFIITTEQRVCDDSQLPLHPLPARSSLVSSPRASWHRTTSAQSFKTCSTKPLASSTSPTTSRRMLR